MTNVPTTPEIAELCPAKRKKRSRVRLLLLVCMPCLIVFLGLVIYSTGGRYVATDNAYVQSDMITVRPEVSGPIKVVHVRENDHVTTGTPLITIDNANYQIELDQARANLQGVRADIKRQKAAYLQKVDELELAQKNIAYAARELRRVSALAERKVVAAAKLDDARHVMDVNQQKYRIIEAAIGQILTRLEGDPDNSPENLAEYRLAKAKFEKAELDLSKTIVRAPFSGRVSKIPAIGQLVRSGTSVMSLADDSSFWIEANLKETDLTYILAGQKVQIEVDAYPDQEWHGTVESISPATGSKYAIIPSQNATGNWVKVVQRVPVKIVFEQTNTNRELRAGMSTTVRIDTEHRRFILASLHKRFPAVATAAPSK